jgi:lysophospholipase L1-like esterase
MFISPSDPRLIYCGRIDFDNPDAPVMVYPSSYVTFRFTGNLLKVKLTNKRSCWSNRMGCVIDGVQTALLLYEDNEEHEYIIYGDNNTKKPDMAADDNGKGEVWHEAIFFKRQDSADYVTIHGFELEDGAELATNEAEKNKKLKIEVYGDSVSCGEVSEAVDYVGKADPVHNGEFSNSWYSYAWMTARKLNAKLHNISQGGIALLDGTGYFGAPGYLGVESCYDKIQYLPDLGEVKQWDFSRYTPDVVVVAIGQNDAHPDNYMPADYDGVKAKRWRERYEWLIRRLMQLYPEAKIVLATTILMHDAAWDRAIDDVCRRIASGRVHHFLYKRNGAGTPGHIRIPEAQEMSEELAAYIQRIM